MIFSSCNFFRTPRQEFQQQQQRILQQALHPSDNSTSLIWAFQSTDGRNWKRQSKPIAHGFTSLGLSVDKELRLSGHHQLQKPTAAEEQSGFLWTQSLVFNGKTWRAEIEFFEDNSIQAHADDQWFEQQLWYFAPHKQLLATQQKLGQDPLKQQGVHLIRSSPPPQIRAKGAGLGDPSPVRFRQQLHLFTTRLRHNQQLEVVHFFGPNLRKQQSFAAVSVPFAMVHNNELWLLVQGMYQGRLQPLLSRSQDAQTWSPWKPIVDIQHARNCTSPVIGQFQSTLWLFCVEDKRHGH